jgi:hypothetical protein
MSETALTPSDVMQAKSRLPWFVTVTPEYYDDDGDTGFSWEGWAVDQDDAVLQALENCHIVNDRDPEDREDDIDTNRAKVHVAEIDFRRFAGPLLHWARERGGVDTPLWSAMEEAVRQAGLAVVPLILSDQDSKTSP